MENTEKSIRPKCHNSFALNNPGNLHINRVIKLHNATQRKRLPAEWKLSVLTHCVMFTWCP